jgi:hypothetical protein
MKILRIIKGKPLKNGKGFKVNQGRGGCALPLKTRKGLNK